MRSVNPRSTFSRTDIFECAVIEKILYDRKRLPLCCFHNSLLVQDFVKIPLPPLERLYWNARLTGVTAIGNIFWGWAR